MICINVHFSFHFAVVKKSRYHFIKANKQTTINKNKILHGHMSFPSLFLIQLWTEGTFTLYTNIFVASQQ